ncbi:choice-of-anchor I family protein [Cesiribacter sp. SM1]|uniref:choice-of-anchor I family protein n=1 Tax=Cesiribacter sp. SM1 TaxID=2861196 RepID=UPI001CD701AC|nr:choice-of-anchor I family protein [Cesiribacter sp. SM1]
MKHFFQYLLAGMFVSPLVPVYAQQAGAFKAAAAPQQELELAVLDSYQAAGREYAGGAAEIAAFDPKTSQVFITNFQTNALDIIKISTAGKLTFVKSIDLSGWGAGPNSVAVSKDLVVVVVDGYYNEDATYNPGTAVFFDAHGNYLQQVQVGHIPDMVTFTPNGQYAVVANEAEPNDDYTFDPEGSVSIIDVSNFSVRTADFRGFNQNIQPGVRIFGPGATVAQDLEPEYITISHDSRTAYVTLQENNAMAVVELKSAMVREVYPLGTKDHSLVENALDVSDRDGGIQLNTWPVKGFYLPDAIASYKHKGQTFLVTANEGDARDYDGYSEEERVKDLALDPAVFPDAKWLQKNENLGRLKTTTAQGDADGDGLYEEIYTYGGRSFSIWSEQGELIWDSKDAFERILADLLPDDFGSSNDESPSFDGRSDDKGPEPEGVTLGKIGSSTFAFIGLERIGGVMVYDISNPYAPVFVTYTNNRNFSAQFDEDSPEGFLQAKDLGPEGLVFIAAHSSPTKSNLLLLTNEVSGTTTLFEVKASKPSIVKAGIQFYPNPVTDRLTVNVAALQEESISIEIASMLSGKVYLSEHYQLEGASTIEIPLRHLPSQLYVVKVKGATISQQHRLLKK